MSAPKEQNETPKRVRSASRPAASVNMEELRELIALLRDNGLAELLENEGFRVRLRRDSAVSKPRFIETHSVALPRLSAPTVRPPLRRRLLAQRIRARRHQQKLLRIRITHHSVSDCGHVLSFAFSDRGAFREDRQ